MKVIEKSGSTNLRILDSTAHGGKSIPVFGQTILGLILRSTLSAASSDSGDEGCGVAPVLC